MAVPKTIDLSAILLAISLFTSLPLSLAEKPKVNAIVTSINKDPNSKYTIALSTRLFLIDLASPIVWSPCTTQCYSKYTCPMKYGLVECTAPICSEAQAFRYPDCQSITNSTPAPIQPPPGYCKCASSTKNPITGVCFSGDVTTVGVILPATDGRNPTSLVSADFVNICAPNSELVGLASSAVGAAGFGRTSLVSLPARLASDLSFHNEFVLCLPSTSRASGVAFFGPKPYFFMPAYRNLDLSNFLSYTTLLKSPNSYDAAYYLDVSGLAINRKAVSIRSCDLQFHSRGNGGVKLSTTIPHTIMRSKIYKKFINAFKRATKGIPKMPAVEPFELCFNRSALGSTRLGYAVPAIDIMLNDSKNWTIFGANSIKDVTPNTACLAFVDGGKNETTAITLGGFQMENSFLHFDVPNSTLGFISTLLGMQTTCSNFNFTFTNWIY